MNLNIRSDFLQVIHIIKKYSTRNEYFPMQLQFTTIYLL
jgi:hypothetical protein